ncbi:MAG: 3-deoxy-manno-octulosonate cytidylyltransferase [Betaproteobacteria bacterium]|nr:3-deoxy-manno-octulosonate cytidylyltransferase [Betaproteobacteria bacterium]
MSATPFVVLIPARLASSRLPNKPLADLAGLPMVVRVAMQASRSQAKNVVVAADHETIVQACAKHGVNAVLTRNDHMSGTDRLAEAAIKLALADDALIVNVQGDEPLIDPAMIDAVAQLLSRHPSCSMSTLAHPILSPAEWLNPHVVKVVLDAHSRASYFSRACIPFWRDGDHAALPPYPVWRHVGLYAYRTGFLKAFTELPAAPTEQAESLEQLRALWHGHAIAVHVTNHAVPAGVDTQEDLTRVRALLNTMGES